MPNKKNAQNKDETDFSSYFSTKKTTAEKEQNQSPIQELPVTKVTNRIKYLIVTLVVLALAQFILFYITQKEKNPGIPEGYQILSLPDQPPYAVPIKR